MKKKGTLLTLLIIAMSTYLINAQQVNKGVFVFGVSTNVNIAGPSLDIMSLSYTSYNTGSVYNYTRKSINLSPKLGYFVVDQLSLGFDLNLSHTIYGNADETTRTFLGISP